MTVLNDATNDETNRCKQIVEGHILDLAALIERGVSLELQCLIDRLHTRLTRASDLAPFTSLCCSPPPFLSLFPPSLRGWKLEEGAMSRVKCPQAATRSLSRVGVSG